MIKYYFNPETKEHDLEVDLADAFKDSTGMTDFVINSGLEAQTAVLSIMARMYQTMDYICSKGKEMSKEHRKRIKRILIETACQEVTLELFNEFLKTIHSPC